MPDPLLRDLHDFDPLEIIFQQFLKRTPLLSLHGVRPSLRKSVSAADPFLGYPDLSVRGGKIKA